MNVDINFEYVEIVSAYSTCFMWDRVNSTKKYLVLSFISFTPRTTLFQMQSPNLEIWNIGFWIIINKPCRSIHSVLNVILKYL